MDALSKFDELQGDVITVSDTKNLIQSGDTQVVIIIHTAVNIRTMYTR